MDGISCSETMTLRCVTQSIAISQGYVNILSCANVYITELISFSAAEVYNPNLQIFV